MTRAYHPGVTRARLIAAAVACGVVVAGLGVRMSEAPFAQPAGTALYAALIYTGVFVVAPATRPRVAGTAAVAVCWAVELLQLTALPAALSERSPLARLVLGAHFDPADLFWYVAGILPLVVLHQVLRARTAPR